LSKGKGLTIKKKKFYQKTKIQPRRDKNFCPKKKSLTNEKIEDR
jgi:hypothetical protein